MDRSELDAAIENFKCLGKVDPGNAKSKNDTVKDLKRNALLKLWDHIVKYKVQFILITAAIVAEQILELQPSIISKRIVDDALVGGDTEMLVRLILLCLGAILLCQVVSFFESYLNSWTSEHFKKDLKSEMFSHLADTELSFFSKHKQGEILNRLNSDVSGTAAMISGIIQNLFTDIVALVVAVVAMLKLNWIVAVIGFCFIPLFAVPSKIFSRIQWKIVSETQAKKDNISQLACDVLNPEDLRTIKLFNREAIVSDAYDKVNEEVVKLNLKSEIMKKSLSCINRALKQIAPLTVYFVGGMILVNKTDLGLTVGTVTAMVTILGKMIRPVQQILDYSVKLNSSMPHFERAMTYINHPIEIASSENGLTPDLRNSGIDFDDVSFELGNGSKVLDKVSLHISPGENVALVGSSSSGKDAVSFLLPRLYDVSEGSLSIAGTNVKDIDLHYLRENISCFGPYVKILPYTIKFNLTFGRNVPDEEIEKVCRAVGIYAFIQSLPDGINTVIDSGNSLLSDEIKDRICIGRTLVKKAPIRIFEDFADGIDLNDAEALLDNILTYDNNDIFFFVTKSEQIAKKADRIVVFDKGTIVADGTYKELKADKSGPFRKLFNS